jgi:Zn-dependent M28 family amino/carboxypeptidase
MAVIRKIKEHVRMLSGEIGEHNVFNSDALQEAEKYIEGEWRAQGYEVKKYAYDVQGVRCSNLEVSSTGVKKPDEIILIGAHYDTVYGSPGANDNSSGVASMLELSRRFSNLDVDRTVRFVAFVNEEPPFYGTNKMGSMVYAKMAAKRKDNIIGVIVLETIGYYTDKLNSQHYPLFLKNFYPKEGSFAAFVSNIKSRKWLKKVVSEFKNCSTFPAEYLSIFTPIAPGASWSDHSSFWAVGYKALMVTDTAFYRYPYYHTSSDIPEKLNYEALTHITEGLGKTIQSLTQMESLK